MKDQFGREISYLRISVTDRCNFRCQYCMEADEDNFLPASKLLSFDEIVNITKIAADLGITKVRLTGGEPLVRPDLDKLISRINVIEGIDDIGITTNGALLADKLVSLKEAGLKRINFSLDTLDRDKFKVITRRDQFDKTMEALMAAMAMGFKVKINTILIGGFNDDEIPAFIDLARENDIEVRFIELMPIGIAANWNKEAFMDSSELLNDYEITAFNDEGVARLYSIKGHRGKVGLISPLSCKFCSDCNRIRLTADGKLKPCLHSADEINLKGLAYEEVERTLHEAIFFKPRAHKLDTGVSESIRNMNMIGG